MSLGRVACRPCLRRLWRQHAREYTQWLTKAEEKQADLLRALDKKVAFVDQLKTVSSGEVSRADKQTAESDNSDDSISIAKQLKESAPLVEGWARYQEQRRLILDLLPHLEEGDPDLRALFETEHSELQSELDSCVENELPQLLLTPRPVAQLPAMISINAGVGGAEAALFVQDLARMYTRYAETRAWKVDTVSKTEAAGGGLRETTIKISSKRAADEVFGTLQWERGVHRVQRVPDTEASGRIHTSTVAVVVLPVYPDTDGAPLVDPKDVRTDVMRSRGAGGQHVNKTESAVRLTHIPTGITVSMQDSRSQHQNREWAWEILRARLSEKRYLEEVEARRATRRNQVKGSDRSDRIRTYNFGQDRVTDHRIGLTITGLKACMEGEIESLLQGLRSDFDRRRLQSIMEADEDLDD